MEEEDYMSSSSLGKKILVLGFLLAILIAISIWQGRGLGQEYFQWLRTGISRINPLKAEKDSDLGLSQDSGLDLSDINLEEIIGKEEEEEEEEESIFVPEEIPIGGLGGPIRPQEKKMTLEEIQQEVNRIAKEVERIDKDVQKLVALHKLKNNG